MSSPNGETKVCMQHGEGCTVQYTGEACPVCVRGPMFNPNQVAACAMAATRIGMSVVNALIGCGGELGIQVLVPPGATEVGRAAQTVIGNALAELGRALAGDRRIIVPPFMAPPHA